MRVSDIDLYVQYTLLTGLGRSLIAANTCMQYHESR